MKFQTQKNLWTLWGAIFLANLLVSSVLSHPGGKESHKKKAGAFKSDDGGVEGSSFEQEGLDKHNEFRTVHGVPPMTLNAEMSQQAAAYAEKLANLGQLKHASREERNGDGENLSFKCGPEKGQTAAEAVTNWYNEVCNPGYNFGQSAGSPGTGHFTQVVWKESTQLGIGKAERRQYGLQCTYVVGRYRNAGNMMGHYAENVPKGSFDKAQACPGMSG
ncbi:Golgi-associated plant pathogenesis-related protein 1-like [Acropora palmata]|uniref:Golgi-associated plant pathogenesis-related protein 1-like n=1 Tax=Acropora palmata TaxID=6131 RepID=UPI003DA02942